MSRSIVEAEAPDGESRQYADAAVTLRLDGKGAIEECAGGVEALFGYRANELVGRHISLLVTYLREVKLVRDGVLDPRLAYLSRCGFGFEAMQRSGRRFAVELYFSAPGNEWTEGMNLIVRRKGYLSQATVRLRSERIPALESGIPAHEPTRAGSAIDVLHSADRERASAGSVAAIKR